MVCTISPFSYIYLIFLFYTLYIKLSINLTEAVIEITTFDNARWKRTFDYKFWALIRQALSVMSKSRGQQLLLSKRRTVYKWMKRGKKYIYISTYPGIVDKSEGAYGKYYATAPAVRRASACVASLKSNSFCCVRSRILISFLQFTASTQIQNSYQ